MLPTQQYSSPSATGGVLILEPHVEVSQKKHLDMPEPSLPTLAADQSGGQPIQKMALEGDELSEDAHRDEQAAVGFVSDFVDKLFTSASLCPMKESRFTDFSLNIRALEDPTFHSILAWCPLRDCFFVIVGIFFFLLFVR